MAYKKRYYKKKSYQKYHPSEDIAFILVIWIIFLWYYVVKIYNEKPYLFWLWVWILFISILLFIWILHIKVKRKYMRVQTVDDMKKMSRRDFEYFIEFMFKRNWFKAKVWKWRKDWWIDVTATKNWEKYLVQCKKWQREKIWVVLLREFYWVMNMDSPTTKWIYVTTSELTDDARKEYVKIKDRLEMWDCNTIEKHIEEFKEHRWALFKEESLLCERCWKDLVIRKATKWSHKWEDFYWCSNFPKCRYFRNI